MVEYLDSTVQVGRVVEVREEPDCLLGETDGREGEGLVRLDAAGAVEDGRVQPDANLDGSARRMRGRDKRGAHLIQPQQCPDA